MKEPTDKGSSPWNFGTMVERTEPVTFMDKLGSPKAGTFGDSFGAINALFSGLAFAGVIMAILMQMEELKLQRQELIGSRKTQKAQERALVIAAQSNANATLLQHSKVMEETIYRNDMGNDPENSLEQWEYQRIIAIRDLLVEVTGEEVI